MRCLGWSGLLKLRSNVPCMRGEVRSGSSSRRHAASGCDQVSDKQSKGYLVLVDGTYLVVSAYHGMKFAGLKSASGTSTGALYRFTKSLLSLRRHATHLAVMFDHSGPYGLERTKIFPGYKGRRAEVGWMATADSRSSVASSFLGPQGDSSPVSEQIKLCKDACTALNIPSREMAGYEADDLLASYALRAVAMGFEVSIITGDKDLMQVLQPGICIHRGAKLDRESCMDAARVEAKYGVPPQHLLQLFAIAGDETDSIPGVPGIGYKKGAALLQAHGSWDIAYKAAEEGKLKVPGFGPTLTSNLLEHREQVEKNIKLIELQKLPIDDPETFAVQGLTSTAEDLIDEHGFDTLRAQVEAPDPPPALKGRCCQPVSDTETAQADSSASSQVLQTGTGKQTSKRPRRKVYEKKEELLESDELEEGILSAPRIAQDRWPAFLLHDAAAAEQAKRMLELAREADPDAIFTVGVPEAVITKGHRKQGDDASQEDHLESLSIAPWSEEHPFHLGEGPESKRWRCIALPRSHMEHIHVLEPFFREASFKKVYYNFSRCYRLVADEFRKSPQLKGVQKQTSGQFKHSGFAGDVMHMAHLWDPTTASAGSQPGITRLARRLEKAGSSGQLQRQRALKDYEKEADTDDEDGTDKVRHSPEILRQYSAESVRSCWHNLKEKLQRRHCSMKGPQELPEEFPQNMLEFYEKYWMSLGELLVDIEEQGMPICRTRLADCLLRAAEHRLKLEDQFRAWAFRRIAEVHGESAAEASNVQAMNVNSVLQLRQLLFGPPEPLTCKGVHRDNEDQMPLEEERSEDVKHDLPDMADYSSFTMKDLKATLVAKDVQLPTSRTKKEELLSLLEQEFIHHLCSTYNMRELRAMCSSSGLLVSGTKTALAKRLVNPGDSSSRRRLAKPAPQVHIPGLGLALPKSKDHVSKKTNKPSVSADALQNLLDTQHEVLRADGVKALETLLELVDVESTQTGYLLPLEKALHSDGRIRACLNINTETGRLSCRAPNLQNLKVGGQYPVRSVIVAPKPKKFIIADYAQLEIRVVAHLANCPTMLEALTSGEDIHSKTAYAMFEEVQQAVKSGRVKLSSAGNREAAESTPDIKQMFPEYRKKAKVLNFSVLYGVSAHRLSQEWNMTPKEAQSYIDRWFESFPAIKQWKLRVEKGELQHQFDAGSVIEDEQSPSAVTLLGRARPLRDLQSPYFNHRAAARRAAVNTPVQGSSADIVFAAMLKLHASSRLQQLGYKQIMQIHDEIILEGPATSAREALNEVVACMEHPLPFELKVPLKVDARVAETWHVDGNMG